MLCLLLSLHHLKCHKEHVIPLGSAEARHRALCISVCVCVCVCVCVWGLRSKVVRDLDFWGNENVRRWINWSVNVLWLQCGACMCVCVCVCVCLYLQQMPALKCFCLLWKLINKVNTFAISPQSGIHWRTRRVQQDVKENGRKCDNDDVKY